MNFNEVWTEPRVDRLKFLWAAGWSCSRIADDIRGGITRNSVISKVHRLKLPDPVGKRMPRRGEDRKNWPRPLTRGSDSKPINRDFRATVPQPTATPHLVPPPAARLRNGYDTTLRRNPSHNILAAIAIAGTEPGLSEKLEEPAVGEGMQLADLEKINCRWPFGHPSAGRFYFCGSVGADYPKQPYCAFHTRKAAGEGVNRKRFEGAALFAAN